MMVAEHYTVNEISVDFFSPLSAEIEGMGVGLRERASGIISYFWFRFMREVISTPQLGSPHHGVNRHSATPFMALFFSLQ